MRLRYTALCSAIILLLSGCGFAGNAPAKAPELRVFTDSTGRKVEIPYEVHSVAPTGPLSQAVLYTACPNMMAGLSMDFSAEAKEYIPEKYHTLPKFGQFYGKNVSLNMEALINAAPDVIVDIGEAKPGIVEDMDSLQKQLGIPVVFIEATLDTMESTYIMLGELTGDTQRLNKLAAYCEDTMRLANAARDAITDDNRVTVYVAMGEAGLNTNARGSFHADTLVRVGADNVADIEASSTGGGSEVSFEQILVWNPQVILTESAALYETLSADPVWRQLEAVQNGNIYAIPSVPYNFIANPPAANRILGIKWLGNLLYPELYEINITDEIMTFYSEFYSIELSDEQYQELMKFSGY